MSEQPVRSADYCRVGPSGLSPATRDLRRALGLSAHLPPRQATAASGRNVRGRKCRPSSAALSELYGCKNPARHSQRANQSSGPGENENGTAAASGRRRCLRRQLENSGAKHKGGSRHAPMLTLDIGAAIRTAAPCLRGSSSNKTLASARRTVGRASPKSITNGMAGMAGSGSSAAAAPAVSDRRWPITIAPRSGATCEAHY